MKIISYSLVTLVLLTMSLSAWTETQPAPFDAPWNAGAQDCKANPRPPLEVHSYNPQTFILRENLCSTFEAPFLYLLIGSTKALLIDTGDVADPTLMPLAETVMHLLPTEGSAKLPYSWCTRTAISTTVPVTANSHLWPMFRLSAGTLDSVRHYYNFTDWPNGIAQIDLGDRVVDVIPIPGHNPTHVAFYDRSTGLLFSGDFLMPGRLLIDDAGADLASAQRIAAFVKDRPVTYVLGGHIELNTAGDTFAWESQYHPNEHTLPMTKDDVLQLPAAVASFNGLYTRSGKFIMMNSMRILIVSAVLSVVVLLALVWAFYLWRRRRRLRTAHPATARD